MRTKLYSVADVAEQFGVVRQAVHYWIEAGYFDGVQRSGRNFVIPAGTVVLRPTRRRGPTGVLDHYVDECEARGVKPTIPTHDFFREEE